MIQHKYSSSASAVTRVVERPLEKQYNWYTREEIVAGLQDQNYKVTSTEVVSQWSPIAKNPERPESVIPQHRNRSYLGNGVRAEAG